MTASCMVIPLSCCTAVEYHAIAKQAMHRSIPSLNRSKIIVVIPSWKNTAYEGQTAQAAPGATRPHRFPLSITDGEGERRVRPSRSSRNLASALLFQSLSKPECD